MMEQHFNLCLQLQTQVMKHHTYVLSAEESPSPKKLKQEGKRQRYQQLNEISFSFFSQVRQTCLFIPNIVAVSYCLQIRYATLSSPYSLQLLLGSSVLKIRLSL